MTTIAQQLHNSATHAAGNDPSCPVCNPDPLKGPIGRDSAIAQIKAALKARGVRYSVRGGRGTAWGWIEVDLLPAEYKSLDDAGRRQRYWELGNAFGKENGYGSISIPASSAHYREYIQRARGQKPDVIAQAYWD